MDTHKPVPQQKRYAVSVDLPDRYWDAEFYMTGFTPEEAESAVQSLLDGLHDYFLDVDLQINDVVELDEKNIGTV